MPLIPNPIDVELKKSITESIEEDSYRAVDIKIIPQKKVKQFVIAIHKPGGVNIDDCAFVSQKLSDLLSQVHEGEYKLEVSSPGIGRKLKSIEDVSIFKGSLVEILERNNPDKFSGLLIETKDDLFKVKITSGKKHSENADEEWISFQHVISMKLL